MKTHKFEGEVTAQALAGALADGIADILEPVAVPLKPETGNSPHVVLLVGVNGSGKTTTAGKLAQHWRRQGMSVMLAAGDVVVDFALVDDAVACLAALKFKRFCGAQLSVEFLEGNRE